MYGCTLVAPKISCSSTEAAVGERNVRLACRLEAKPSLTSLFWIIAANGTTLPLTASNLDSDKRQFHARLHVSCTAAMLTTSVYSRHL